MLYSIQYLRGVAALMVVLVHVPLQLERMGSTSHWPQWLNMGVDIFFVISGFIMWTTTCGTAITPAQFLQRRLVRIVPLYWLLTGLTVVVLALAPNAMQSGKFDADHIVKSLLFIAAEHPVTHLMQPVLVPGWTLNLELLFYAAFALCLTLPDRLRALGAIMVLVGLTACHGLSGNANSLTSFYTSDIILEFGYGLALGVVYTHGPGLPRTRFMLALGIAAGAGAVALVASDLPRSISFGVPAFVLVAAALAAERMTWIGGNPPLQAIGDASYSLYLTHGILLSMLGQVWRKIGAAGLPFNDVIFTITALVVTTLAAVGVYHGVERPIQRRLRTLGRDTGMAVPSRA